MKKATLFVFLIISITFLVVSCSVENTGYEPKNTQEYEPKNTQEIYDEYVETGEVDWESVYGDDWEDYVKGKLEEEGYRVIDVSVIEIDSVTPDPLSTYFGDVKPIGKKKIRVEMEALGNRADQLKEVVFKSILIENRYGYWIEIHESTQTCTYVFRWVDWVSCLNDYSCSTNTFLLEESLLICR